jgi:anti-anti-sigma factor
MLSAPTIGPSTASVASQFGPEPFCIEVHPDREVARVVPAGELDLATVGQVDARLRTLHASGFRRLVLDLRRLTFLDSTGLHLAMSWDTRARQDGIAFTLIAGPREVQRTFDIAGLTDALPFADA